jgi:hypothetical protein
VDLKSKAAATEEGIKSFQADTEQAKKVVQDAKTDLKRAEAKYFGALYDAEVERLRADLLNLTGLYRLANKGRPVNDQWHILAVKEMFKRLTLRDKDTQEAAEALKIEL